MSDKCFASEIADSHLAPGRKSVTARDNERQLIAIHHNRRQCTIGRLISDDAEVGSVVPDIRRDATGERASHRDTHVRITTPELVQQWQDIQSRKLVGGHDQLAAT